MSTLATLKTRIADELSRSDLTSQIALAITDAIGKYQKVRFYFNETGALGETFNTGAGTETYTSASNPNLPFMYDLDDLFITVSGNLSVLQRIDPTLYRLQKTNSASGQPYNYMWLNQTISLWPVPDQAYTITMVGHYKLAAPASDSEANNKWMTDAERLIRSCAKRMLYEDVLLDQDAAAASEKAELDSLIDLKGVTATMVRAGFIQPVEF